ncbi:MULTISPECIES: restriction endonuclease subunit S [unclassified Luteococcus]|uniref:restriction endonuclease subunit S n=1 Tax=unclassified Luteococcus TaxID=2639923 RepID=UPI00313D3100
MKTVPIGKVTTPIAKWNPGRKPDVQITYIDLSSINQSEKRVSAPSILLGRDAPSRARQLVAQGDVLVSTVRPNLNAVARVNEDLDGATASTGFTVLRPTREIDSNYLFHWVRTSNFVESMVRSATGASYPAVSDRIVKASLVPLPSLPDQRRIAMILDQADALCAKRRTQLTHLDALPQAIFHEMFAHTDASDILGEHLQAIETGISLSCEARGAASGEWGILKLSAVTHGIFRAEENKAFLGDPAQLRRAEVHRDDILMTRKNTPELVGHVALVQEEVTHLALPDLVFRLRLRDTLDPFYFQTLMMSPHMRRAVRKIAGGAAASMSNISGARLRTLPIAVADITKQRGFAKTCEGIRTQRDAVAIGVRQADALFSSLQSRAFRGEL